MHTVGLGEHGQLLEERARTHTGIVPAHGHVELECATVEHPKGGARPFVMIQAVHLQSFDTALVYELNFLGQSPSLILMNLQGTASRYEVLICGVA